MMKENNTLLGNQTMKHSYPHCWRCKKPIIFRATEQWFISVDHNDLRKNALSEITKTKWFPSWGETRIRSMVEGRPDWCISRQRSWGIPIPAFYCTKCNKPNFKGKFNAAVIEMMQKSGSDAWFEQEAKDILPKGLKCEFCGGEEFTKETDIMDVWLESGSSHNAVLKAEKDVFNWPADLYLEGSDQHRGWFQSSLLTSMAGFKAAPFKAVLTHGFTVDEKGKKMSKSLGNTVLPQDVMNESGADVLRLWVASTDFRNDMAVSKKILKQIAEGFSKIRNTCRFLISNINDFDNSNDKVAYSDLKEIDKYALFKLELLSKKIREAYDNYEFHVVYHSMYTFCVNDLSSFYMDIIKDRLYCDGKKSVSRRAAQTVCSELLLTMIKLLVPVLSFTSEDIYQHLKKLKGFENLKESLFLETLPAVNQLHLDNALEAKWETILAVKAEANKKLEEFRATKVINQNSECDLYITADAKTIEILKSLGDELNEILQVSGVSVETQNIASPLNETNTTITITKTTNLKCERCWRYLPTVGKSQKNPGLCKRCEDAVGTTLGLS